MGSDGSGFFEGDANLSRGPKTVRAEEDIGRRGGRTFVGSGNGEGGKADGAGEAVAGTPVGIL